MSDTIVLFLLFLLPIPILALVFSFIFYVIQEQEHKHKLELEQARQGIFDPSNSKQSFFKEYSKQIIVTLIITMLVVFICFIFNVPSDLAKYILELIQ